jgi:PKD domain-containing protein
MKTQNSRRAWYGALALGIVLSGCGLEEVDIPDFSGPSALGTDVRMTASPDILLADGLSTSLIQATIFDQNGRAAAGRDIVFSVAAADGTLTDLGQLRSTGPDTTLGTSLVVRTDGSGVARVVYLAPPRTDLTANFSILIATRPVGTDFNGQIYRTVSIELRSAEPRLFPPNPGNIKPSCGFTVEPSVGPFRVNQTILFQSTSFDPDGVIVRYEWFFGDGTKEDSPDTAKVYRAPGTYVVAHIVTDNNGARSDACTASLTVIP